MPVRLKKPKDSIFNARKEVDSMVVSVNNNDCVVKSAGQFFRAIRTFNRST